MEHKQKTLSTQYFTCLDSKTPFAHVITAFASSLFSQEVNSYILSFYLLPYSAQIFAFHEVYIFEKKNVQYILVTCNIGKCSSPLFPQVRINVFVSTLCNNMLISFKHQMMDSSNHIDESSNCRKQHSPNINDEFEIWIEHKEGYGNYVNANDKLKATSK